MDSAPTLTIGVPVYNMAAYLEEAVESVLAQSFQDLELIISDNASTDGTAAIGRALGARDPRVTYRRNSRNIGLVANNNLLVPLARGRLFKWMNADDVLRPGYLERCVAALVADPAIVLAYPQTDFVDGEGNPLDITDPGWPLMSDDPSERLLFAILAGGYVNASLGVIRTDALRRTRLLPRYAGGDYRMMAELALLGKFIEIPERLFVRRIHVGASVGNIGNAGWMRTYMSGSRPGVRAPYWRLSRDRIGIVMRARIPVLRKAVLLTQLARTMRLQWRRLYRELLDLRRA